MNRNLLIGLIVVILAIGGFLLVQNKSKTTAPTTTQTTTATTAPSQGAAMEEKNEPSGTMEKEEDEEYKVTLTQSGFEPQTITIKAGEKVTWENKSGTTATVNSDPHPTHTDYPPLNLGKFNDGATLELTFDKAGTYGYHNHFNPSQKGTVVVK